MESTSPICIFFLNTNSKHHTTLNNLHSNLSAKVEIYNTQSLLQTSYYQSDFIDSTFSYSGEEPYFVRLRPDLPGCSPQLKIGVSLVSVNLPIIYSKCRAEALQNIIHIDPNGNRIQPSVIQSQDCINIIDELQSFVISIGIVFSVFIISVFILHCGGCIDVRYICDCFKPEGRYGSMKVPIISSSGLKNPMDIESPRMELHSDTEPLNKNG